MDRTKETLAWLRTVFALAVVLDVSLIAWIFQHSSIVNAAAIGAVVVVALALSAGLIWITIAALRLLRRLGDTL